jgi:hypothetical protein
MHTAENTPSETDYQPLAAPEREVLLTLLGACVNAASVDKLPSMKESCGRCLGSSLLFPASWDLLLVKRRTSIEYRPLRKRKTYRSTRLTKGAESS